VIDEQGKLVDSVPFDGLSWRDAIPRIVDWLSERGAG